MEINAIGSTDTGTNNIQQLGLGQEDFLRILLTQLSFQDPLKPLDNQEFIAQMAQFTNLELTRQLADKNDTLLTIQSANQAINLIGKTVEVRTESGSEVGNVTTVTFNRGVPEMTVQKPNNEFITGVGLSQIFIVRN